MRDFLVETSFAPLEVILDLQAPVLEGSEVPHLPRDERGAFSCKLATRDVPPCVPYISLGKLEDELQKVWQNRGNDRRMSYTVIQRLHCWWFWLPIDSCQGLSICISCRSGFTVVEYVYIIGIYIYRYDLYYIYTLIISEL